MEVSCIVTHKQELVIENLGILLRVFLLKGIVTIHIKITTYKDRLNALSVFVSLNCLFAFAVTIFKELEIQALLFRLLGPFFLGF